MQSLKQSQILDKNLLYYGFSTEQLMEAAGKGIANNLKAQKLNIGIFCGLGNNGGDGFCTARYLLDKNKVTVYLLGDPRLLKTKESLNN